MRLVSYFLRENIPLGLKANIDLLPASVKTRCISFGTDESYYLGFLGKDQKHWKCLSVLAVGSGDVIFSDSNLGYDFCGKYKLLEQWIQKRGLKHEIKTLQVSLGPNDSFWATSNEGFRWSGLPTALEENIQNELHQDGWHNKLTQVMLGINGTYIMGNQDGPFCWDLDAEYPELDQILENAPDNTIAVNTISSLTLGT